MGFFEKTLNLLFKVWRAGHHSAVLAHLPVALEPGFEEEFLGVGCALVAVDLSAPLFDIPAGLLDRVLTTGPFAAVPFFAAVG